MDITDSNKKQKLDEEKNIFTESFFETIDLRESLYQFLDYCDIFSLQQTSAKNKLLMTEFPNNIVLKIKFGESLPLQSSESKQTKDCQNFTLMQKSLVKPFFNKARISVHWGFLSSGHRDYFDKDHNQILFDFLTIFGEKIISFKLLTGEETEEKKLFINRLQEKLPITTHFVLEKVEIETPEHKYFYVRTLSGRSITFSYRPGLSILAIKQVLSGIEHISIEQQALVYQGIRLEDHTTLLENGINDGSTIHLILRLRY